MSPGAGRRPLVAVLGSYAPSLVIFRGPMIRALVERGYEVVAMAPDIAPAVAARVEALGARPMEVALDGHSLNPIEMMRTVRRLRRCFREMAPEAVIGYTVKPATLGILAAAGAGVPRPVAMVTGLGYAFGEAAGLRRRLVRTGASLLYAAAFRRSSAVIFQNDEDAAQLRRRRILPAGANAVVVAGSGIDLGAFPQQPVPAAPRFLMIARLIGEKGVREYAAAAARLRQRHPQARFALAGFFDNSPDAIGRDELDRMIGQGIEYLGKLDDVRPALAEASAYVLPSYFREGTPRSILEAMSTGRAIVTTDMPGCRNTVVPGRNGFIVPPRDIDALTDAMERLILDPDAARAMGGQSRAIAEQKYDVRKVNADIFAAAGL